MLGGPFVDYLRAYMQVTKFTINGEVYSVNAYRMVFAIGFALSFISFILVLCCYSGNRNVKQERGNNESCLKALCSLLRDSRCHLFILFSLLTLGLKLPFTMLTLLLPRLLLQDLGPSAPFGLVLSLCPLLIIVMLFVTAPCTLNLKAFAQITLGAFFVTLAPVSMLFDDKIRYHLLGMFLTLLSLGEAMYQPKMYEVTFDFAKKGHEGLFMSVTALPYYMTMAAGGYLSGYLLDKYSPLDAPEDRQTDYIWLTLIVCSGSSLILLILFKRCFKRRR